MARNETKEITIYNGNKIKVRFNSYPVDPDKLRDILAEKNLQQCEVSKAIGYAGNSLSSALYAGYFKGPMIVGLKAHYGIDYSEYEYKLEEPKKPESEQPKKVCADETALYKTMKLAMVDAITEALAANMKNLRGMIYTAINQAKQ